MPIVSATGSILDADADALVNPVNTQGVMSKGLAMQFKIRFRDNYLSYKRACKAGELTIGTVHVYTLGKPPPKYIINLPTKEHWRDGSQLEYVREGLAALLSEVRSRAISSVAIPPLGCGLGGLAWAEVRPLIVDAFASLDTVRVILYEPLVSPAPTQGVRLGR